METKIEIVVRTEDFKGVNSDGVPKEEVEKALHKAICENLENLITDNDHDSIGPSEYEGNILEMVDDDIGLSKNARLQDFSKENKEEIEGVIIDDTYNCTFDQWGKVDIIITEITEGKILKSFKAVGDDAVEQYPSTLVPA